MGAGGSVLILPGMVLLGWFVFGVNSNGEGLNKRAEQSGRRMEKSRFY